jgi:hypothetical protein
MCTNVWLTHESHFGIPIEISFGTLGHILTGSKIIAKSFNMRLDSAQEWNPSPSSFAIAEFYILSNVTFETMVRDWVECSKSIANSTKILRFDEI